MGSTSKLGLARGKVRLSEPIAGWTASFTEEASRLEQALRAFRPSIEHCGSTSVAGIPAKPILDILLGLPAPLDVGSVAQELAPLGYEHATWAGVPGHEVFGRGDPRTHLLHAVPLGSPEWQRMLSFRDALRADASLAQQYAQLKRRLAAEHSNDRAAYTEAKSAFIERVISLSAAPADHSSR